MKYCEYRFNLLIIFCAALILNSCSYKRKISATNISLSPIYSSGMIFQRDMPLTLNGHCSSNGVLAVKIEGLVKYAMADDQGNWEINFPEIDYSGSFNIVLEGLDANIDLSNVLMGDLYVIVGDGWLSDNHQNYNSVIASGLYNEDVRYFQPELNLNAEAEFKGEWKTLSRQQTHTYEYLSQLIGEGIHHSSQAPIGIINLICPGLNANDILSKPAHADSVWNNYFDLQKQYQFLADSSFKGIEREILEPRLDDRGWLKTDLPIISYKKWYLKNKIVWLRNKILMPEKFIAPDLTINLGLIRGQFNFYLNGKEIDKFNGEAYNYKISVPDSLLKVWSNVLTVRMVAGDSLSGFYSPSANIINSDSSYRYGLSEDWKIKSNYEPQLPKLNAGREFILPVNRNAMESLEEINVKGLVIAGGYDFYKNQNSDILNLAFEVLAREFKAELKGVYLISRPGIIDSMVNQSEFNNLRNLQLEAAAKNNFRIINTMDNSNYSHITIDSYNFVVQDLINQFGVVE